MALLAIFVIFGLTGCESEEDKKKKQQEEASKTFRKKSILRGQGQAW